MERTIARQEQFESSIEDAGVLFEFAEEEDEASLKELRELLERLEHEIGQAETEMLLAGENDQLNAICTIHPGAGGTESQDWAEMLLRMYLKWAVPAKSAESANMVWKSQKTPSCHQHSHRGR